jgi:hypothetical protein
VPLAGLMTKVYTGFHHLRNEFVNHCILYVLCVTLRQDTRVLEGAALSPQPSVVGIAASAGTHRITISLLNVKQNDAPDEVMRVSKLNSAR